MLPVTCTSRSRKYACDREEEITLPSQKHYTNVQQGMQTRFITDSAYAITDLSMRMRRKRYRPPQHGRRLRDRETPTADVMKQHSYTCDRRPYNANAKKEKGQPPNSICDHNWTFTIANKDIRHQQINILKTWKNGP